MVSVMKSILHRIHERCGDLWWYAILLFVAQRFGDVMNMFVGMWLVPKYVPQEELGAVLPLMSIIFCIRLDIFVVALELVITRSLVRKAKLKASSSEQVIL